ncbi:MAG: ATP-binding protein, partial [Duodenibacillus sp.]|nr:ATP-binding protein [Duodenibacillus sp.]
LQGASEWAGKLMSGLASAGLRPQRLTAEGWLRLMGTVLNWGPRAGWRRPGALWDKADTLDSQVLDWDTRVALAESDLIALGEAQCVKVLSAKTLARKMFFGEAMCYAGDLSGQNQGVKANYAVAANVWWPPLDKERGRLARMRQWATQQALGPLVKFEPVLGDCKRSHDVLYESMTQSAARPVRMSFSVLVFAEDRERASRLSVQLQSAWATQRFRLMEDRWVMLPMLVNCLPLGADAEAVAELWRYHTLTTHELPVLLPVMAEWKGTGTPHVALLSRNGQLMSLSLHDGSTNRNAVVAAESGSGKSFFLNELIVSYLSAGAQVWVIDAGKSYHKLCLALGGAFLAFDGESAVHLNPFAHVDDWEDEEDALVAVAAQMASARGDLSEFQTAEIKRIMKSLHDAGRLSVDALREACLASGDRRTGDVGAQLYAFSSGGAYGRYFRGGQAQPLDGRFTVLELDELQGRRHLRQVVLLELIEAIERTMIRGDRSRKKLLIIDEAWDLLKDGAAAAFMEQAYRKFRKYNGSAIIATQSVADLYDNPAGRAIAENSASLFLLGQKAEAIEAAREKKQLVLSPAGFHTLKGVHTEAGAYSEIFLRTEAGQGVGRLVVSDFQKLLYSTSAEDVHAIEAKRKAGMSIAEAIGAILRERRGGAS